MKNLVIFVIGLFFSISIQAGGSPEPFQPVDDQVDIESFMGDWYVIAVIPTPFEKGAVNGVENYRLNEDGTIKVTYTYRKDKVDGKEKTMYQKGWVTNQETGSEWVVQPLWPFKLPYLILDTDDDHSYCVIGTNNYDYLWIMSREPEMEDALFKRIREDVIARGYKIEDLLIMTQEW